VAVIARQHGVNATRCSIGESCIAEGRLEVGRLPRNGAGANQRVVSGEQAPTSFTRVMWWRSEEPDPHRRTVDTDRPAAHPGRVGR